VGALVSVADLADRPPVGLSDGDVIETGRHRLRFVETPHLPHGWDSGLFFDETTKTLLCGDLFTQPGNPPALVETDLVDASEAFRKAMDYYSNHAHAALQIRRLAGFAPRTLATMHGSSFRGDAAGQLRSLAESLERDSRAGHPG
jgi:flavorubredoxin